MFCPHCGAESQKPEAYCTRCGTWLVDPHAVMRHGRRIPHSAKSPEQKLRAVLVFNVIDTLLAFASFFLLLMIKEPAHVDLTVGLALVFSLIIAVHQAVSFKFNLELRRRLKRGREEAQGPAAINAGVQPEPAPRALDAGAATQFARPFSVTENTTELLERVPRERRERG
jgi:hypothetical protein